MEEIYNNHSSLFKHSNVRRNFIRKVYGILSTQLLLTFLMVFISTFSQNFHNFLQSNFWLFYVSIIINIFTCVLIFCYDRFANKFPNNYIFLLIFTISESIMVSFFTTFCPPRDVLIAIALTAIIVLSLTYYSVTTKTDFTL